VITFQTHAGWAFQKGSPYLEVFNHQLSLIKLAGLSDRLMQKQLRESNSNCHKSPYNEIKFENVLVAFVMLACGGLAAILTLIFEHLFHRCYKIPYFITRKF
jgi:hypothetical protein